MSFSRHKEEIQQSRASRLMARLILPLRRSGGRRCRFMTRLSVRNGLQQRDVTPRYKLPSVAPLPPGEPTLLLPAPPSVTAPAEGCGGVCKVKQGVWYLRNLEKTEKVFKLFLSSPKAGVYVAIGLSHNFGCCIPCMCHTG